MDWARDGRCQLALEDNKIWLHMRARIGLKALIDDASEARAGALEARSRFLCYPCEVALCEHITGLCSYLQFVFCRHELTDCDPSAREEDWASLGVSSLDSVVSECASSEASIPLGGDATTFRKSLLTQLEEGHDEPEAG